tara:strand:+ start:1640 stop:1798 length:159 start_codon:yes stop_codon:yes gene_type:complete
MVNVRKSDKLKYNLTEHFKKHSSKHNRIMRREMVKGNTADDAHKTAKKNAGN